MNPQTIIKAGAKGVKALANTPFGRKLAMNAPKILFATGVVSTVGAVGASIVGGIKAAEVIEETRDEIEMIHDEDYEENKDESKALLKVYMKTGGELIKIFWPTILLTGLSIGCFSKGYSILNARNAALVSAYNGLDKMFQRYRRNVIDAEGEDKDEQYYLGIGELDESKDLHNGVEVRHYNGKLELPWEDMEGDPYSIIIDSRSRVWSRNPETMLFHLKHIQEWANMKLNEQGSLFLNELREELDVPRTKSGAALGWVVEEDHEKRRKSNYVDLGIFYKNCEEIDEGPSGYFTKAEEILDGGAGEPILLRVNPDGIVYDLMK